MKYKVVMEETREVVDKNLTKDEAVTIRDNKLFEGIRVRIERN